MSGREGTEKGRQTTLNWIYKTFPEKSIYYLVMREEKDNRADYIVKEELYIEHILGKYNVKFVLDDRSSVVKMWREKLGLPTFQVAPGDF